MLSISTCVIYYVLCLLTFAKKDTQEVLVDIDLGAFYFCAILNINHISVENRVKRIYIASNQPRLGQQRIVNYASLMWKAALAYLSQISLLQFIWNKLMLGVFFASCMMESKTVLLHPKQYILLTMKCRLLQPLNNGGFSLLSVWSFQIGRDCPLHLNAQSGYSRPLGVWSQPLELSLVFLWVDCTVEKQKRVTKKNILISYNSRNSLSYMLFHTNPFFHIHYYWGQFSQDVLVKLAQWDPPYS